MHKDWPEDLLISVDKYTQKMWHYGYVTDYDQVFEQLGMAILVLQHKLPNKSLDDLMSLSLMAEIFDMPHKDRKEELRKLSGQYASYLKAKKEKKAKKERLANHKESNKGEIGKKKRKSEGT